MAGEKHGRGGPPRALSPSCHGVQLRRTVNLRVAICN